MEKESLSVLIKSIPETPGVYKYFDSQGKLLYIGKAKNLKKRVSSYFTKQQHETYKTKVLVSKISSIEFIVVPTEYDALLLENTLIKENQPKYNINLKDDKTYPFIKITKERFPRVFPSRRRIQDGSTYYGPYASVSVMHAVLDLIKKLYPVRNCSYNLSEENIRKGKFRLCMEYQIGNCKGPCTGLQTELDYVEQIAQIRGILKGNLNEIKQKFKNELKEAVQLLAFEEAHKIKQQIEVLEKFQSKSTVVNPAIKDVEVMAIIHDEGRSFVNYLRVTHGMVVQSRNIEMKNKLGESPSELLVSAWAEIRVEDPDAAPELLLPFEIEWAQPGVIVTVPKTGDKKTLLDLSVRNAFYFKKERIKAAEILDPSLKVDRVLQQLKKDLRLKELPKHIECFDNSNFLGNEPVSACVVFRDAKPDKSSYRLFNVKTVVGPDDFATMKEVITRRYTRLIQEGSNLPQLIVVDGGKGQLSAAVSALKEIGIYGKVSVLGIAKRLEELFFPEDPIPLYLDKKSETLRIIQFMRDEAHRFGITHHRKRRDKKGMRSELDGISGIGPKTIQLLLDRFKSVKAIKQADLETLKKVIDSQKAAKVFAYFNENKS
jgi:excinuclease ABC subunit C